MQWVGRPGKNKLGEGKGLDNRIVNFPYKVTINGGLVVDPKFLSEVSEFFGEDFAGTIITMCRSGTRSAAAAQSLEEHGYFVLDMDEGFEGDANERGYRTQNGWKNTPWTSNVDGTETVLPYRFGP